MARVRLHEPVGPDDPLEAVVDDGDVWRSPSGNYCAYAEMLVIDGEQVLKRRTIVGFRACELAEAPCS